MVLFCYNFSRVDVIFQGGNFAIIFHGWKLVFTGVTYLHFSLEKGIFRGWFQWFLHRLHQVFTGENLNNSRVALFFFTGKNTVLKNSWLLGFMFWALQGLSGFIFIRGFSPWAENLVIAKKKRIFHHRTPSKNLWLLPSPLPRKSHTSHSNFGSKE